jgi:Spy/CpxP family protein refolding chaperone
MTPLSPARKHALLIGLTVLAVCAGVVAGMVAAHLPHRPAPPGAAPELADTAATSAPAGESAGLAEELKLTAQQREEMRAIWENVRDQVRASFQTAENLQRRRDDEVFSLLTDAQKAQFQKISKDYADRFAAVRKQREQRFADGVERSRKLLNDSQRQKYDELLRTHVRPEPSTRPAP